MKTKETAIAKEGTINVEGLQDSVDIKEIFHLPKDFRLQECQDIEKYFNKEDQLINACWSPGLSPNTSPPPNSPIKPYCSDFLNGIDTPFSPSSSEPFENCPIDIPFFEPLFDTPNFIPLPQSPTEQFTRYFMTNSPISSQIITSLRVEIFKLKKQQDELNISINNLEKILDQVMKETRN